MTLIRSALLTAALFATLAISAQQADILVQKSGPEQATAGSNVTYQISITNLGPDPAVDADLDDELPAGMTFVSFTQTSGPLFTCTTPTVGQPGEVNCETVVLPSGSTATFTLVTNIPAATAPGTFFVNIAEGESDTLDPNEENNFGIATTSTPPPPQADLGIVKQGPASAGPGTNVTYTFSLTNSGPNAAANVELTDTLPGTMTFVSLVQTAGPTLTCATPAVGSGGTITCTAATFAAGSTARFTLTTNIPAGTEIGTEFTNTAVVTTTTADPNPENDGAPTTLVVSSADVVVTKTGPATANASTTIAYTITVRNDGTGPATSVVLTDELPAGSTFVSLTRNSGPTASCSTPAVGTGGTVTCTIGQLLSGQSAQFTLTINAPASGGDITNTARVTTETFDPDPADNQASAVTSVTPIADIAVAKSGPETAVPGQNVTYTITVSNAGPSSAANVSLTDTLPANTTLISFTQNSGPAFSCVATTCNIATFASGATATFTLVARVASSATGTIQNTATVTTTTSDPSPANNSSTVPTTLSPSADLGVVKSGPNVVTPGTDITYTISLTNGGPSDATSVVLTDVLPAGTTYVSITQNSGPTFSCTAPAIGAGGTVQCSVATFVSGATATFTLVVRLGPSASGTLLQNTASVTSATPDPAGGNNTSTSTVPLIATADVGITKTGPATATAGETLTYTINAVNNGPSDAPSVTILDALPANTTFVSIAQNSGPTFSCTTPAVGANGTITCTLASLVVGGTASFTLVINVSPAATGTLQNTASIDTTAVDPVPANDSSTATVPLTATADVGITKTGPATATAGETLTYSISAVNNGPSDAPSVTITDALPANTTFVSIAQNSGPTFSCTAPAIGANGTITCTLASLVVGGTASFTLVINVSPAATGTLQNTASIDTTAVDPVPANDSSTAPTTVGNNANLSVTKGGPPTAIAGSQITYMITLTNGGPSDAANVTLTDAVPAGTTFVSAVQTAGPTFNCTTSGVGATGTITCSIASMASGATASFTLIVEVAPTTTGPVTNTATVNATTPDPVPANNSATVTTAVAAGPADLRISKSAPATAIPGTNVTFTIVTTNDGPSTAINTVVTDALPAGSTLVSASSTQGTCSGTTTVTCTVGELAPSASATITLVVRLPFISGPVSNTATVTAMNADADPGDNASTVAIAVANPEAIPALSPLALLGLAVMLGLAALYVQRM